jgi:transcriptional regulator with XRE-family HTH domain
MGKLLLGDSNMFNNNLKEARENLGMTQKELGYIFGVHETTISGWETAKDNIPLKKLVKFCNLYNYSLDFVVGLDRKNIPFKNYDIKLDKKEIGNKLKSIRKKLNLTQQQLADECGISQTTYSNYELGINLINIITLYAICKNYKISMDSFLR